MTSGDDPVVEEQGVGIEGAERRWDRLAGRGVAPATRAFVCQLRRKAIGVRDGRPGQRLTLCCIRESEDARSTRIRGTEGGRHVGVRPRQAEVAERPSCVEPPLDGACRLEGNGEEGGDRSPRVAENIVAGELVVEGGVDLGAIVTPGQQRRRDRHRDPEPAGLCADPFDLASRPQSGEGVLDRLVGIEPEPSAVFVVRVDELAHLPGVVVHQEQRGHRRHVEPVGLQFRRPVLEVLADPFVLLVGPVGVLFHVCERSSHSGPGGSGRQTVVEGPEPTRLLFCGAVHDIHLVRGRRQRSVGVERRRRSEEAVAGVGTHDLPDRCRRQCVDDAVCKASASGGHPVRPEAVDDAKYLGSVRLEQVVVADRHGQRLLCRMLQCVFEERSLTRRAEFEGDRGAGLEPLTIDDRDQTGMPQRRQRRLVARVHGLIEPFEGFDSVGGGDVGRGSVRRHDRVVGQIGEFVAGGIEPLEVAVDDAGAVGPVAFVAAAARRDGSPDAEGHAPGDEQTDDHCGRHRVPLFGLGKSDDWGGGHYFAAVECSDALLEAAGDGGQPAVEVPGPEEAVARSRDAVELTRRDRGAGAGADLGPACLEIDEDDDTVVAGRVAHPPRLPEIEGEVGRVRATTVRHHDEGDLTSVPFDDAADGGLEARLVFEHAGIVGHPAAAHDTTVGPTVRRALCLGGSSRRCQHQHEGRDDGGQSAGHHPNASGRCPHPLRSLLDAPERSGDRQDRADGVVLGDQTRGFAVVLLVPRLLRRVDRIDVVDRVGVVHADEPREVADADVEHLPEQGVVSRVGGVVGVRHLDDLEDLVVVELVAVDRFDAREDLLVGLVDALADGEILDGFRVVERKPGKAAESENADQDPPAEAGEDAPRRRSWRRRRRHGRVGVAGRDRRRGRQDIRPTSRCLLAGERSRRDRGAHRGLGR